MLARGTDQLVLAVREYQASQRQLSVANGRASALCLYLTCANRADNARLARQQNVLARRLDAGERAVGELQDQVGEQAGAIQAVAGQVDAQEQGLKKLHEEVDAQRARVQQLAAEYRQELEAQRQLIEAQRLQFGSLVASKLRQDATLDAAILVASWVVSKSPVVDWPVRLLATLSGGLPLLPGQPRARAATLQRLARLAAVVCCARALRIAAARRGLHNSVGTPDVYAVQLVRAAMALMPSRVPKPAEKAEKPAEKAEKVDDDDKKA